MLEQALKNRTEARTTEFSPYFTRPPNFELLKLKQDMDKEITEADKDKYNFNLGE